MARLEYKETVAAFITGWVRTFGKETLEEALMSLARMSCFNVAKFLGLNKNWELWREMMQTLS